MTAAPPGQGGHGHFNLQYKAYWIDKMQAKGYTIYEDLEDKIIEWCKIGRETNNASTDYLNLSSVFDVGCATGHWLSVYENEGLEVSGLEGTTNSIPHMMVD